MYDIFISYRKNDTTERAEYLYDLLKHYNPNWKISYDRDNLTGEWHIELIKRIDSSKNVIVLIGDETFNFDGEKLNEDAELYEFLATASLEQYREKIKQMRIQDKEPDYLRLEIARALKNRSTTRIVPVVLYRDRIFGLDSLILPKDIEDLKQYQSVSYHDHKENTMLFKSIIGSVVERLNKNIDEWRQDSRGNKVQYKIRVNCPSILYIDDKKIQELEANKLVTILLYEGVYWRKVEAIYNKGVFDEKELNLSGWSKLEKIDLDCNLESQHEYVDLGLSVKWATCNVGAKKPEEYGDYFAWGESQPKKIYDSSTYEHYFNNDCGLIKYCTNINYGKSDFIDKKTVLDSEDDAATANWGGSWRMPTYAEQDELINNCKWIWTTQNGVNGYKVVGPNGNSIFLPAAGYRLGSSLYLAGSYGYCWSSSLNSSDPNLAYSVNFDSSFVYGNYGNRDGGFAVRPVCP